MAAVTESKDGEGDASAKKLLELGVDGLTVDEKVEAVATGPCFLQKLEPVDPTVLGLPEDFDFSTAANEFKLVRYDALAFKRLSVGNDRCPICHNGIHEPSFSFYSNVHVMEPPGAERVALSQEASVGKGKGKGKDKDKQKGKGKDEDHKKENEEEAGNKKVKRVWDELFENAPKDPSVAREWRMSAKMSKKDPRHRATPGETIVIGRCCHAVHEDCLRKFHKSTNVCPVCTAPWASVHAKAVMLGVVGVKSPKRANVT